MSEDAPDAEITTEMHKQPRSAAERLAAHAWKPGQSGNPKGRPKGSRNKFGEQFIEDFLADWEQHGAAAIRTVREERPQDYLKAAVAILPKEVKVVPGEFEDLSDDELTRYIRALGRAIGLEIADGEGAGGKEAPH